MHEIINQLLQFFFSLGYTGIAILMAIESSFIPFPSEIIIPPAAYLAQQGKLNIYLVIVSGVIGSLAGALFNYYFAYFLGRKFIYKFADSKFGKLCLINSDKVKASEAYFIKYGNASTFIGRLVPVIRQLISLPAGLAKMNLVSFVTLTTLGSTIWCGILAFLGYQFGANQDKLKNYYQEISYFGVALFFIFIAYLVIKRRKK